MKKYLILSLLAILIISCSEDAIDTYEEKETALAYFQLDESLQYGELATIIARYYTDSTHVSFSGEKIDVEYLYKSIPIKTMGRPMNYDRKIAVKVDTEFSTAIENKDFTIDYDSVLIKAGQSMGYLNVKLMRVPELLNKELRVEIELVDNEYFEIMGLYNNCDVWSSAYELLDGRKIKITYNESISIPSCWNEYEPISVYRFFGAWATKKYAVVSDIMDWSIEDWERPFEAFSKIQYGSMGYAAFKVRDYLQKQADAPINNPIRELDGKLIQLGPNYLVDYSRYK